MTKERQNSSWRFDMAVFVQTNMLRSESRVGEP